MELMEQGHLTEEAIEAYALGRMADPEAESLEEHILLCAGCQDRLQQMDEFVSAFKVAAVRMEKENSQAPGEIPFVSGVRRALSKYWQAWTPVYALGGAVAAAALLIAVFPRDPGPLPGSVAIELNAVRGAVPVVVAAPHGARLSLVLDLTGMPPAPQLKVEMAGASGQVLWTGNEPRPATDKLTVNPPVHPNAGLYWVRIYDAGGEQLLLREFGLRIRE